MRRRRDHAGQHPVRRDRRMILAAAALFFVVLFGTVGFMWIEDWDLWRSFFFTLISITTVGYGDEGLSEAGQRFTAVLLVGGIGVVTYVLGQVVQIMVDHHLAWERTMNRRIQQLDDHFIICGFGRIGRSVCEQLDAVGVPFVAVDQDRELVERAVRRGYAATAGDATEDDVLERCGILRARGIACVTRSDTENIVITLGARGMNPDLVIISRAEQDDSVRKMQRAGATSVFSPSRACGTSIANTIMNPEAADVATESGEDDDTIGLTGLAIMDGSRLDGQTVEECFQGRPSLVLVAVKGRDLRTQFHPALDKPLQAGDVAIVAGDILAVGRMRDDALSPAA